MGINVEHMPSAMSYGKPLAKAAAADQHASMLMPFVSQYMGQQFQSGESEKQRGWQTGESALDRNLTMYGNDKQLAMQALLAQYNAQQQEAITRLQTGKVLNPQPLGYTRGGQSNIPHTPQYGFPSGLNYQSVLNMPQNTQPLLTSNTTSRYQRG